MAVQTKTVLKSYFETGDKPTQAQFADLIDSLFTPYISSQAASFTASDTNGGTYLCNASSDSGFTATLPTAATASGPYTIKKVDGSVNPVKIIGTSGQTIDGLAYIFLYNQNDSVQLTSDGTNWRITG